ncbi:zf-HC2 domain-containing protein [Planococcus salinarum]|uniref:zf-HC2 domain-containing protein n=1 Tax=Planococcus salinarum TaxID=622695 RepID=UPI000E3BA4B8|nr:zf-HC2 domain-containing protein [Planococcus salinarum]TAA71987.1 zf-HC2 domain-containing protein [Planococcus salinarum]
MKNECYIVRDLLPSYIDQLCSDESKVFIEQHMSQCDSCSRVLQHMRTEFDDVEQVELPMRIEQKKPFEKVARFLTAQGNFTKFLKASFWLSLFITIILLVFSFNELAIWQEDQQEAQRVEQQQQDIMAKAFTALSAQDRPNETALQTIFEQYQEQLQHIAIFSTEDIEDTSTSQEGPTTVFPIDYERASLVLGEGGEITESIVPNEYDIGTMAMANNGWVVQFEYKQSYLETVEAAHQIKYYSPSAWTLFSMPIVLSIISLFIFITWRYQKQIMRPMRAQVD